PARCPAEPMDSEDLLYLLYTSGSTGKPKGIIHTTGGYLTGITATHKWIFDLNEEDVYWCTADIGWVTGHSYIVYGPLANGATSWQTEPGQILITPLPGITVLKPGSATKPFPGVEAEVFDEKGNPAKSGYLVLTKPWPAMLRGIWGDPDRYVKQYWSKYDNIYFTGDGAKRDADGYFWLLGRVDDVMNVSGHRVSTMEVESAL